MRRFFVSAVAAVVVAALSCTAFAGEIRRAAYQPRVAAQAAAQPAAAKATVVAEPSNAELRARIAELTKRVQALEAAAAESRRQIAALSNQLENAAPVAPAVRPIAAPRPVQPTVIISNDLYPNEYPYGG